MEEVEYDPELLEEILSRPNIMNELAQEDGEEDVQFQSYGSLNDTYPSENPVINFQSEILRVKAAKNLFDEISRRPFTFETKQKLRDLVMDVSDHLYQVTNYNIRRRDLEFTMNDLTIAKETLIFSLPKIDITHHLNFILSLVDKMYFAVALSGVDGFARKATITQILKKYVGVGGTEEDNGMEQPKKGIRR